MKKVFLEEAGCENVKWYGLINNDGYTFTRNGIKYDLRHWLSFYGAEVDFWSLNDKDFNSFEGVIKYLNSL